MCENISLKQARDDYDYITSQYGEPCDFCGTLCNNDLLSSILEGKITRKEAYIQMIEYIWQNGLETGNNGGSTEFFPDETDKRIQRIKERYSID
ncbi:hypothetical protein NE683_12215 [Bariatricus massiliensis]|uniref:Uncharacterized protein n=1 Tax=Bariatricus massiliensis TaxID=1745713 RepID=A0ABS8DH05_9FIRM|nr:hypothetical protein [Bariatricus massiliensis]MCB7306160.1 hypothetical protein [Bariatricus massiliensis]MCB7375238.1 hypothetical protein [Bariatricus massiliensis]MCB7387698.1 hypothetical protein [Bariatricus massiliensis]MCB7411859.1 hypothetical protein [Bariatricus massiliensis]MCQ5253995.1 hypothetical protein [Bariatricus massiliensis]